MLLAQSAEWRVADILHRRKQEGEVAQFNISYLYQAENLELQTYKTVLKEPILAKQHPFWQFIIFLSIVAVSLIVISILGGLLLIPIYDVNILLPGALNNLDDPNTLAAVKMFQLINAFSVFIIPPVVFAFLVTKKKAAYLQLNQIPTFSSLIMVAIVMVAAMPAINWMVEMNSAMHLPEFMSGIEDWMRSAETQAEKLTKAFLRMDTTRAFVFNLFLIAVIPAIGEELLFRGVMQKILVKWTGSVHVGIWIAAALFSAMHGQFFGFFPRMMLGAMFGYMLVWSGSLWLPILGHFINNGAAVVLLYLNGKGVISDEVETIGTGDEGTVLTISSIILVCGLMYMIYKSEKRKRVLVPDDWD